MTWFIYRKSKCAIFTTTVKISQTSCTARTILPQKARNAHQTSSDAQTGNASTKVSSATELAIAQTDPTNRIALVIPVQPLSSGWFQLFSDLITEIALNFRRCDSGECIPKSWECDHDYDCKDFSDEHSDCANVTCSPTMFQCNHGKCLDKSVVCDGWNDCGDHSDELNCFHETVVQQCKEGQFHCSSNMSVCLDNTAKCNGTTECPGGEDEQNCNNCGKLFLFNGFFSRESVSVPDSRLVKMEQTKRIADKNTNNANITKLEISFLFFF